MSFQPQYPGPAGGTFPNGYQQPHQHQFPPQHGFPEQTKPVPSSFSTQGQINGASNGYPQPQTNGFPQQMTASNSHHHPAPHVPMTSASAVFPDSARAPQVASGFSHPGAPVQSQLRAPTVAAPVAPPFSTQPTSGLPPAPQPSVNVPGFVAQSQFPAAPAQRHASSVAPQSVAPLGVPPAVGSESQFAVGTTAATSQAPVFPSPGSQFHSAPLPPVGLMQPASHTMPPGMPPMPGAPTSGAGSHVPSAGMNPSYPQMAGPPQGIVPPMGPPAASGPFPPTAPGAFPPAGPGGYQPGVPPGPGGYQPGVPPGPGGYQPSVPAGPGFQGPGGAYPPAMGMGGMPQQRPQQKLDPNMMPSAVQVREDDSVRSGLFPTGYPNAEHPPLVTTDFFSQDQGNCNPRFMRSTCYFAPQTADMLKHSHLPFAVAISPFAALSEKEHAPPIVDLGPQGPIRCQRCKAYMCPFMEFQDGGRRFRCPFCNATTPVEDAYFAHLDHTGRRTDIEYRPELLFGAYEFVATKQYCKNGIAPKEPAFIFMIDVSYNAVQNGMLSVLCKNLECILARLPRELGQPSSSIRVGLATFDQAVHFFDLSSPTPSMLVVGDVSDVFVPCVDGLLLPYEEALPALRSILAELPNLFSATRMTETILGPVVQAGLDALRCADRAGKLFVFSCSLPVMEAPGKLKNRDDRKLLATDKEKTVLLPQTEFYTKLGEQCVKGGCTVDLFLFPNSYIDVATLGQLTAVTGGSLYKYQYFDAQKDSSRFLSELTHDVSRQIAFDCMLRVRSSAGIRPVKFHGSFFMENTTDMEVSSIDQDKAFFVELKHDDKLSEPTAVIQSAVLYTSCSGQRRLRIINLCLSVTADFNAIYRVADQDALATYLLKIGVEINRERGQKDTRDQLTNKVSHILATYREKCSEQAPLGQLILPETLKVMPCLVNSILKNDAIAAGSEMTVDDKAWLIELIRGIRVEDAVYLLYPRVVPISQLEINEAAELTSLPTQIRASSEFLKNDTAYLIDAGVCLFLWIGLGVPAEWVHDVFGVQAVTMIDTENHVVPEKDNARSRALRKCVDLVHQGSARRRKMFLIREKDALEGWMKKFLVEDKVGNVGMSYVDYLCFIHREIRNILS